jgi:membrane-associated phospholipid phosphatase
MKHFIIALGCVLFMTIACPVNASQIASNGSVRELRYDLKLDLAVTSLAVTGWIITEVAMDHLAPASCRWCQVNSFDDWGHRNLKWSNANAASKASHATAYLLAPAVAFGLDALAAHREGSMSDFAVDALVITEAAAISSFATQLVKIATGRERPSAHYGTGAASPSQNTSFYSGHTSLAFSLAVASGTVASMRGYALAPWIWGTGLAIAGTTAYLRVAADKHYLTDVIAGAVLGSAVGFVLPYLFHRPKNGRTERMTLSALPAEGGGFLSVSGSW